MSRQAEIKEFLVETISGVFKKEPADIVDATHFVQDLDAKSVDIVHVINQLEDEYDLAMPFMQIRRQETVGELADFLTELIDS